MGKQFLPTESYKGVRDFYPEEHFVHEYILDTMQVVCERFGYEGYNASVLEPAELYKNKSAQNEEIVNEQTYTFTDRGEREVTLRPEMTPTVARMIAGKRRDLAFPVRWYSVPNVFRYERPQRGRLREHWQLNADIFGAEGVEAEAEIIALAHSLMLQFGATENDFEIRVSDRRMLSTICKDVGVSEDEHPRLMRLLDRRLKINDFDAQLAELLGEPRALTMISELSRASSNVHLESLCSLLQTLGVNNVQVDTSIVRGFDYYTGMVFEVYGTSPENRRSMFGGGRYDNLIALFSDEKIPAVGFGMGDVTMQDFLETHGLIPTYRPATELMLCVLDPAATAHAMKLAQELRVQDVAVAVNFSGKRIGDQIKHADKLGVPYVIAIGSRERDTGTYTLKHLATGNERTLPAAHIPDHLLSAQG